MQFALCGFSILHLQQCSFRQKRYRRFRRYFVGIKLHFTVLGDLTRGRGIICTTTTGNNPGIKNTSFCTNKPCPM